MRWPQGIHFCLSETLWSSSPKVANDCEFSRRHAGTVRYISSCCTTSCTLQQTKAFEDNLIVVYSTEFHYDGSSSNKRDSSRTACVILLANRRAARGKSSAATIRWHIIDKLNSLWESLCSIYYRCSACAYTQQQAAALVYILALFDTGYGRCNKEQRKPHC